MSRSSLLADDLRARHFANRPLLLANVWDASSARAVAGAGHRVIGASLGVGDQEQMTPDMAFAALKRIAGTL
jgi:2-methylisocitrate lyase-like PEP mutase family enzyme